MAETIIVALECVREEPSGAGWRWMAARCCTQRRPRGNQRADALGGTAPGHPAARQLAATKENT